MMPTFKLVDDGYSQMRKITSGRKWVGRVVPHAEGGYVALLNGTKIAERGPTWVDAFEAAVSRHLGFGSAAELRARNREVRRANSARKAYARYAVGELHRGNDKPFFDLAMGRKEDGS